ncbi:hypothetical protein R3P38DRAFT_3601781 [Favolaschia claudopus]|uniref:C2H2-type domain-containing protein n=1 Tax=Favolaschia claudopus TaxID=2862362 RepID=A0AAW0ABD7_9AGAR
MAASPQPSVDMCDSDMEQYFDFDSASCDPSHQPKAIHPDVIESGMDVYFDFDAASSESVFEDAENVSCVDTNPIEANQAFCLPSQPPLVEVASFIDVVQPAMVPEQDLDAQYDTYAMQVGVEETYASVGPDSYHDTTIQAFAKQCGYYKDMDPNEYLQQMVQNTEESLAALSLVYSEWTDSEPSSAPGSPSSVFSTPPLSPSPIPSSCDDESMSEYSDEDCNSDRRSPILPLEEEHVLSGNGIVADSPAPSNQDSPTSSAIPVHSPPPESSSKTDTALGVESVDQVPADIKPVDPQESECLSSPRSVVDDDDYSPSRSPSPAEDGPVHRVGHTPKRKKRKSALKCPKCDETFTRLPDLNRHDFNVHTHRNRMEIYRDLADRKRRWCMGCLHILSRDDSRRRHEDICVWFKEYSENGARNAMFLPFPEIYAEKRDEHRQYCLACQEIFDDVGGRSRHEVSCRLGASAN